MSDYRYCLNIRSFHASDLAQAMEILKQEEIVPHLLVCDYENKDPNRGNFYLSLSTDSLLPYGACKGWDDQAHEQFFHELSLKIPGAIFEFSGRNMDDPNDSTFVKAFHGGLYREVYQDNLDLVSVLHEQPWRQFGLPAPEQTSEQNTLRSITVLVCTWESPFGTGLLPSLHPDYQSALQHALKEEKIWATKDSQNSTDTRFSYTISEHTLDIDLLQIAKKMDERSENNTSICSTAQQSLDEALSVAKEKASNSNPNSEHALSRKGTHSR